MIKNPPVTFHEILGLAMLFGGQKFLFLEIEENQNNQTAVSNEHPFSIAARKQKNLVVLIVGTSADIIMFSDIPISLSNNQDFTKPSLCGAREIEVDGRRNH